MVNTMKALPTILLADDDVLVRIALAEYLRACGYQVIEAAGALEAKTVIQEGPEIGLVLADAQLAGGEGGFGLAQWVRRHRPDARIMLAATLAKKIEVAESLCDGEKPCSTDLLMQRIQGARTRTRALRLAGAVRGRRSHLGLR
jgi:DNA-binding response OmpR family regulator